MTRLVVVTWVDSIIRGGWIDRAEAEALRLVRVTTVGHLIAEHDDGLVIAASVHDQDEVAGVVMVPRQAIIDGPHEVRT